MLQNTLLRSMDERVARELEIEGGLNFAWYALRQRFFCMIHDPQNVPKSSRSG